MSSRKRNRLKNYCNNSKNNNSKAPIFRILNTVILEITTIIPILAVIRTLDPHLRMEGP